MALIIKSTKERVVKMWIVTVICFGFAAYCQYDAVYKYSRTEQTFNYWFNQIAVPVLILLGIWALRAAIKSTRLKIEADEQTGIRVNGREPIAWDQLESIDTSTLAKKGYLYLKYRTSSDESAILKLDEYNLDFFDELYTMIRAKLGLPQQASPESKSSTGRASSDSPTDSQNPPV